MNIPSVLARRLERPAAVLGAGVSGAAAASLLASVGARCVVYDERGVDGAAVSFDVPEASGHDLVVYSPGFPQQHPWLSAARRAGALCLGELDFASLFWKTPVVAVTGTNGKTTLTEFLTFAHKRNGREAVAVGNVGYPFSRIFELGGNRRPLPVCEVSSFQAEDLRYFAPEALLWTNFDEDHLERHSDMETYFRAKYKLVERLAGKRLIVGESVVEWSKKLGLPLPEFTEVATRAEVAELVPAGSVFNSFPQRENFALARRYWLGGITDAEAREKAAQAFADAAAAFSLAGHRLTNLAEIDNVFFWDDSKGTNFHATLAALESVGALGGAIHWIGGGQSKGGDICAFAEKVATRIKSAALIGETAGILQTVIQRIFDKRGDGSKATVFKRLPDAVRALHEKISAEHEKQKEAGLTLSTEHVLFSPGFASFDMFSGYAARGRAFEKAVNGFRKGVPLGVEVSAPR